MPISCQPSTIHKLVIVLYCVLKYTHKYFVPITASKDPYVIFAVQLLQQPQHVNAICNEVREKNVSYYLHLSSTEIDFCRMSLGEELIILCAMHPLTYFLQWSYFLTLSCFQVCMVIVVVHWLMRSKGLIGSLVVHEIHF